ncbi:hypothetical protein ACIRP7_38115, partial [Streptomyces sp. NPDC102270]|uniref:hypothetical protein n=1 Tax=Streptomyces sp. NPDC102270 TaxID=3366150 RepID=UPI003816A6F7
MNSPLPTFFDIYPKLPYQYPLADWQPIVRIPVAGPAPFNTLAVVRTQAWISAWGVSDGVLRRRSNTIGTGLVLANYDPKRPEQQHVIHSSAATVHMMQITPEQEIFADDNTAFHIAVDAIVTDSTIDQATGRWTITVEVADRWIQVYAGAYAEISSWVLCFEPPDPLTGKPASGSSAAVTLPDKATVNNQIDFAEARRNMIARLIAEHRVDHAVRLVPETIAGYRQYSTFAGADVMRAGRDLSALANQMS